MPSTRVVPDSVWTQLDPTAGRLSRRQRVWFYCLGSIGVIVLGLGVWAGTQGHIYPRIEANLDAGPANPATQNVRLDLSLYKDSPATVRVSAITIDDPRFSIVSGQPAAFTLRAQHMKFLHLVVHVRDCSTVRRDMVIPVAAVTDHWWGHQSREPFSEADRVGVHAAWRACHGG